VVQAATTGDDEDVQLATDGLLRAVEHEGCLPSARSAPAVRSRPRSLRCVRTGGCLRTLGTDGPRLRRSLHRRLVQPGARPSGRILFRQWIAAGE
jgi:hypothetical protein